MLVPVVICICPPRMSLTFLGGCRPPFQELNEAISVPTIKISNKPKICFLHVRIV